jgi:sugar lactone lactonase YvrE
LCGCPAGRRPAGRSNRAGANLIWALDYDLEGGRFAKRRVFTDEKLPGFCDGSAIDTAGYLWNARVETDAGDPF